MKKQKVYFEEWYVKILDVKHEKVLTMAIHLDQVDEISEGILQITYDTGTERKKISFPIKQINGDKNAVEFDNGHFNPNEVLLNINRRELGLKGQLSITNLVDLNKSFFKPGVMGIYKHIPFLEFYHETLALQGNITGQLCIDGHEIDFSGGSYYLQKQWGNKFPNIWLWAQASGFEKKKDLALMIGVARLKLLFNYYTAFSIPIYYNNQLEIFSNYNGGHIAKLYRYKGYIHLIITQKDKLLDLKIYGRDEVECISSKVSHGIRDIYECDRVKIEIKISQNGNVLLEDVSSECSIEMGGNTSKLK